MNQTRRKGAQVNAHQSPEKVLPNLDSRTVDMEVVTR